MKLFLAHTMVFVGSIWKNKSGWFLFVMSPELSVATEVVLTARTALRSTPELASPGVKISFLFKGFLLLFPIRDPIEFS